MSKVSFILPIENLQGKISQHATISHRTLHGTKHTYTWNPNTVVQVTPGRLLARRAMAEASRQASAELRDPERRAYWTQLLEQQGSAAPLNAFVVKHLFPAIKLRLQQEQE